MTKELKKEAKPKKSPQTAATNFCKKHGTRLDHSGKCPKCEKKNAGDNS